MTEVITSKTSVSVNGADITGLCEFTTPDDGIDEIRCKLPLSQPPIAHIAGSPGTYVNVWSTNDRSADPRQLTSGCTLGGVKAGGETFSGTSDPWTRRSSVSCTQGGLTTIVTCPPPPVTPGIDPELTTHPEALRVKFSVPFEDPQM